MMDHCWIVRRAIRHLQGADRPSQDPPPLWLSRLSSTISHGNRCGQQPSWQIVVACNRGIWKGGVLWTSPILRAQVSSQLDAKQRHRGAKTLATRLTMPQHFPVFGDDAEVILEWALKSAGTVVMNQSAPSKFPACENKKPAFRREKCLRIC